MKALKTLFLAGTLSLLSAPAFSADFQLTSSDISEGQKLSNKQVMNGFGCKGGNISPALSWSGAPEDTKSFVVTAYDPDAPTGSGFWHWVVANIPANVTSLPSGVKAEGLPEEVLQAGADAGPGTYIGACPPPGDMHRYVFTVHALKVDKLPVDKNASGALVGFMTGANRLASAKITAVYWR
ncbi:MAG: YbhB/YbcL family Raf kinase inhibitor-like protein [Sneathiella sp.]